jgi:Cys-rich repeat protein
MVTRTPGNESLGQACVRSGEHKSVTVSFGAPPAGCLSAGCPVGLRCATDGSCVACLKDGDCASGMVCQANQCVGRPHSCTTCDSDAQCGSANSCLALEDDEHPVCIRPCGTGGACLSGFECVEGACLPASSLGGSCVAYRVFGMSCSRDGDCWALPSGVCVNQQCTLACNSNADCPGAYTCVRKYCALTLIDE